MEFSSLEDFSLSPQWEKIPTTAAVLKSKAKFLGESESFVCPNKTRTPSILFFLRMGIAVFHIEVEGILIDSGSAVAITFA